MTDPSKLPPETAAASECASCGAVIPPGQRYCSAVYAQVCRERKAQRSNGHARIAPPSAETAAVAEGWLKHYTGPVTVETRDGKPVLMPGCNHAYALGSATCRMCGHSDAPKTYPGATTALQAELDAQRKRADELAAALSVAQARVAELEAKTEERCDACYESGVGDGKLIARRDHADELARVARAFAERERGLERDRDDARAAAVRNADVSDAAMKQRGEALAERDAAREQLRAVLRAFDGSHDGSHADRGCSACLAIDHARALLVGAAMDGTAPAPREAELEGLIAAVDVLLDCAAHIALGTKAAPIGAWNSLVAARDAYQKSEGRK